MYNNGNITGFFGFILITNRQNLAQAVAIAMKVWYNTQVERNKMFKEKINETYN